jgi:hypothetical protein
MLRIVRPLAPTRVVKELCTIKPGTVFTFGTRMHTFLRTDEGVVRLETGEVDTFNTDQFEDYVEFPDAQLVLRP